MSEPSKLPIVDIEGFDRPKDASLALFIADRATSVITTDGVEITSAYSVGHPAAFYAGEFVLTALRNMGEISEDFDEERFRPEMRAIANNTLNNPEARKQAIVEAQRDGVQELRSRYDQVSEWAASLVDLEAEAMK